jgi:hypothetical protein
MNSNRKYTCAMGNLRYRFAGIEWIGMNYSQAFQDMFVLSMLKGKRRGKYVEIGGNHGIVDNNTYLLETLFGWDGVAFEIVPEQVKAYNDIRRNKCICADATTADYASIFAQAGLPKQIDYLQLDIEPAMHTLAALKRLPHDQYRFSVITFETELYCGDTVPQSEALTLLTSLGYERVITNVKILGRPFEDWYVDPRVVDPEMIKLFRRENAECGDCIFQE